jgi:tocopherol cyclase
MLSPGAMGWYTFLPFMQTYRGILSLDHRMEGSLTIDLEKIDFSDGRGTMEKNWGKAFPRAYIWIQSNHFSTPGTSLTASVATIPWLGSWFRGFIVGLWHNDKLYRFTT